MECFQFAGFAFPRRIPMIKRDAKASRWACSTAYSHAPKNGETKASFYLDSDFAPGLRWAWCDDVSNMIRHQGWHSDEYGDSEAIRGVVFRLPHGRGFLAGWSMGEGMASAVDYDIIDDEKLAAHRANDWAERVADDERDAERAFREEQDAENEGEFS